MMVRVQVLLRHVEYIDELSLCLAFQQELSNEYTEITLAQQSQRSHGM